MNVSEPRKRQEMLPEGRRQADTGAGPGQAVSHVQGTWSNEEALATESRGRPRGCWKVGTSCAGGNGRPVQCARGGGVGGGGVIDHVEGEGLMAAAVGTAV